MSRIKFPAKLFPLLLSVAACSAYVYGLLFALLSGYSTWALIIAIAGIAMTGSFLFMSRFKGGVRSSGFKPTLKFHLPSFKSSKKSSEPKAEEKENIARRVSHFIGDYALVRYISKAMESSLKDDMPRAMIYLHPTTFSRLYGTLFIFLLAAATPTGIILFIFLKSPLFLIISFAPFVLITLPTMETKIRISNRKSDASNEFPFFLVYATSLQAAGLSLFSSMDRISEWRILPKIRRESLLVKRDYTFFSHNPLLALENVARDHPDENIRTVILGYTSVLRSGGDLIVYLNSKVKDGLNTVVDRWKRYAESASTLGEISIAIFLMFPSLLIAMAVAFSSNYSLLLMQVYAYAFLPLMGAILIMTIHTSQPKFLDIYNMKPFLIISVVGAAVFAAATYFFIHPMVYWLASVLLVFTIILGAEYLKQHGEVIQVEKALPYFLRDITEMMKIGYSINQTLIDLPKQRDYNKTFDRLLHKVAEHLEMNMPLKRVAETMRVRSWLCNYVFFILSEIVDTGGGTPEVLESLTSFVNGVCVEKAKAKSTTRSYSMLGYATPAFLSAVMVFMTNMLLPSLVGMGNSISMPTLIPSGTTLMLISETGMMVAVLTAFVVGLLIAKIVDMSVYATYHASIALVICLVCFSVI